MPAKMSTAPSQEVLGLASPAGDQKAAGSSEVEPNTSNGSDETESFVTAAEAARFLCISPITIKKMARAGSLPAHAIGNGTRKRWRFLISELALHMAARVNSNTSSVRALRRKAS